MNFRQNFVATCLLSIFVAQTGISQQLNYKRLTLRSDFPSKTVLLSNANQELGVRSPFLVAAAIKENNTRYEYRSLLQFNYDYLPEAIKTDPHMISSAYLVLFPANADFLKNNYNEPARLLVKRITGEWTDSIIAWDNQPVTDSNQFATEKITIRKKDWQVKIDVTYLVKDMLLYGNKGFLICQSNPVVQDSLTGLSFASSLNDNKNLRPLLVITYSDGSYSSPLMQSHPTRPVSAPVYLPVPRGGGSSNSDKSE
jgi:hypothetical protein